MARRGSVRASYPFRYLQDDVKAITSYYELTLSQICSVVVSKNTQPLAALALVEVRRHKPGRARQHLVDVHTANPTPRPPAWPSPIIAGEHYRTIVFAEGRGFLDNRVFEARQVVVIVNLAWVEWLPHNFTLYGRRRPASFLVGTAVLPGFMVRT
jgi:hypothetical protein